MTVEEFLGKWEKGKSELGDTYVLDFRIELKRDDDVILPLELNRWIVECIVRIQENGRQKFSVPEFSEFELKHFNPERPVGELLRTRIPQILQELDMKLTEQAKRISTFKNKPFGKPLLVIVTGAGFSAGFGVPVTEELSEISRTYCQNSDFNPRIGNTEDWKKLTQRYPVSAFSDGTFKNIEHLLTFWTGLLDQAELLEKHTGNPYHGDAEQLMCDYNSFLFNLCYHLYDYGNKSIQKDCFKQFVDWLRIAYQKYEIRFLTFNYDLIIEKLIKEAGLEYKYLTNLEEKDIPIRKIHGSLNWGRADKRKYTVNHPESILYAYGKDSFFWDPNLDALGRPFFITGVRPEIITPDARKEYRLLAEHVWGFATGDLISADKLLIVGYSFPPIDFYAEKMMSKYIRQLIGQGKQFTYINPCPDTCNRVKEILELDEKQIKRDYWNIDHFYNLIQ